MHAVASGSHDLCAEVAAYVEAYLLREVLRHTGGNQVQSAKVLGMARNSLRKKMTQFGISIDREVNTEGTD